MTCTEKNGPLRVESSSERGKTMNMVGFAQKQGSDAETFGKYGRDEVVELAILLPAGRAEALVDLSRKRRESVAQILRGLIDQALAIES